MLRTSSTEVLHTSPLRPSDDRDKRKRDDSDSEDDEPLSKRARTRVASPGHPDGSAKMLATGNHLRLAIVAQDARSSPMATAAGHEAREPEPTSNVLDKAVGADGDNSKSPSEAAEEDDDWDDWVLSKGAAATSAASNIEDLHWAELERLHRITPPPPPPPPIMAPGVHPKEALKRMHRPTTAPEPRPTNEAGASGRSETAATPPLEPPSARASHSPLSADESEGPPTQPAAQPVSAADAAARRLAKIAQNDELFPYREWTMIGADRIKCGCGRRMNIDNFERHLREACTAYVSKPVLPTPARKLLASRPASPPPPPPPAPASLEAEDDAALSPAALRVKLLTDPRAREVQGESVQCDACGKWFKITRWPVHITKACAKLKTKGKKKYWVYVSDDDD